MVEKIAWKYSVISGGKRHEIDAEASGDVISPKKPHPLLPQPMRIGEAQLIDEAALAKLPDKTIVAHRPDTGAMVAFEAKPFHSPKKAQEEEVDIPQVEFRQVVDEISSLVKAEYRLSTEATKSPVMTALSRENPQQIISALERLPASDVEDVEVLVGVVNNMMRLGKFEDQWALEFARNVKRAAARSLTRH